MPNSKYEIKPSPKVFVNIIPKNVYDQLIWGNSVAFEFTGPFP